MKIIINGKAVEIPSGEKLQAGEGINIDNQIISVSLPSKALSQEEYNALSEEEKRNGSLYIIPGATSDSGSDPVPTGTVISYLGTGAPNGYLACDGQEYLIEEYYNLAEHIAYEFGTASYFGGDGETTFAVPDMRNLFLRGYCADAEEQLSGAVGERQEATQFPGFEEYAATSTSTSIHFMSPSTTGQNNQPRNVDKVIEKASQAVATSLNHSTGFDSSDRQYGNLYTSRPVNMAVLYCIKT